MAVLAVVVTSAFIAGCGTDTSTTQQTTAESGARLDGDFTGAGDVPGALVAANSLSPLDIRLTSLTSIAARVTYTSTSGIDDSHTEVTGSVFIPRGTPPDGGWPVLAYAHPGDGSRSDCAPSSSSTLSNSSELVAAFVRAGFVVTMPDYQGLGNDSTYYPYLDSTTAGYNLIDSVRAARKLNANVSTRWVAIGTGLGGQAGWAANELVENYGGDLDLVGVAALSPAADVNGLADLAASGDLTRAQKLALVAYLQALRNEYDLVNLDDFRRGAAARDWNLLMSCAAGDVAARAQAADRITPDDLRPVSPEAVEVLRGYLQKTTLPLGPTKAPMLVIYGGRDPLIPAPWTAGAVEAACRMGDVIDAQFRPDDAQIDPSASFSWALDRMAGVPATNSCEIAPAAETASAEPTEEPSVEPEQTFEPTPEPEIAPATIAPAPAEPPVGPLPGPPAAPVEGAAAP